ncbi:MAG: hypothetical protein JXB32_05210 [Deltaproteobacteria bacterium]|nr:hypothetical protein [Deltaproteobacteria bacterium]
MKRFVFLFPLAALLLPTLALGATGEASKQTVTVTGEVYVPPPPTVVVDVATPPPPTVVYAEPQPPPPTIVYAEPQPQQQVVYAQPQPAYGAVAVGPEVDSGRPSHQLSVGVGVPLVLFGAFDFGDTSASGGYWISDEFLWINLPIVYRYRINDYLAAGGGLMFNIFAVGGYGAVGAELMGSFRAYAIPDWLYFEANILLGFPLVFSIMPSVGVAIPLGSVSIFLENQIPLFFFGGVFGFWQPTIGVEFAF